MSPGAAKTLVGQDGGLVFQPGMSPREGDFFSRWYIGDFTDPATGLAFKYSKQKSGAQGKSFASGRIDIYMAQNSVVRYPISSDLLAKRVDVSKFENFLSPVTEQSIVNDLIEVLSARSPMGIHEYVLLKQAFPQMRIPDPPAEAAYVSGGFGQPPAAQQPAAQPQLPAFQHDNLPGLPPSPPPWNNQPPVYVPPASSTVAPVPPPAVTVVMTGLPPPPPPGAPAATAFIPPPPPPPAVPLPVGVPPPPPAAPAAGSAPVVPGDPVPAIDPKLFSHQSFLDGLTAGKK
jgi:hypothetical protein